MCLGVGEGKNVGESHRLDFFGLPKITRKIKHKNRKSLQGIQPSKLSMITSTVMVNLLTYSIKYDIFCHIVKNLCVVAYDV